MQFEPPQKPGTVGSKITSRLPDGAAAPRPAVPSTLIETDVGSCGVGSGVEAVHPLEQPTSRAAALNGALVEVRPPPEATSRNPVPDALSVRFENVATPFASVTALVVPPSVPAGPPE